MRTIVLTQQRGQNVCRNSFHSRTIHIDKYYVLSSLAAEEWLDRITTLQHQIYDTLRRITEKPSTIHIEKARQFNIHDYVLLDRCNLQVKARNNKFLTRTWLLPYKVIEAIGYHAYRVEVPEAIRWHNVVHTTLLKSFRR